MLLAGVSKAMRTFLLLIFPFVLVLCEYYIESLLYFISDRKKIHTLVKTRNGHVIKIKKSNREKIDFSRYRKYRRHPRYSVIYQIEDQKIACIADFEKNSMRRKRKMRLFNEEKIK